MESRRLDEIADRLDDIATILDELKDGEYGGAQPDTLERMSRSIEKAREAIDRLENRP